MILVGRYRSPFARRVAIALRRLGIDYEHRPITAWTELDEVTALNPVGRVPALVLDDGEVLYESGAVVDYIDTELAGPERALVPAPGPGRRTVLRLTALAMGTIEKAVACIYERNMRPKEKIHEPWLERCGGQARSGLEALDAIEPAPWLAGERFTLADLSAVVGVDLIRMSTPELMPPGRYPRLESLAARCAELPEFAHTQPEA